ncbi:hypothetical protein JHL22_00610 [Advenella sp. WQ 585]|uniref:Uncharacterized protein n=1 Tax=Advenella mandrilli TaxID=2800330 RepID=A0ABS1ECD1_9BURK|nr:hypothetical protein [Advenella mandrilli]MBK1779711.1 hypothetical protein [Advenella mandrilli]
MTTINLTDVTVSSDYTSRTEGWMSVHFSNGNTITAHCPEGNDNWAQGTKLICNTNQEQDLQYIKVNKLLLQAANDGKYVILQADLPMSATPMTHARPANENVYMALPHKQQSVFSADFLAIVCIIIAALYGLKWLFEKYLLPRL